MMTRTLVGFLSISLVIQPTFSQSRQPTVSANPSADRLHGVTRPYLPKQVSPASMDNSARLRELMRDGNLYLSLMDALALAIENNLDIELQRFSIPLAATDTLRAQGGGLIRGLDYVISSAPAGVGGPQSPLVTQAATQSTQGTSVASSALELGTLAEPQTNLSLLGTTAQSNGSQIPTFDPTVFATYNWTYQTTLQSNSSTTGTGVLNNHIQNGNVGFQQGFGPGTQVSAAFNNMETSTNAIRSSFSPFVNSNLGVTVTQPLLRGFGSDVNRRFIRIGQNEEKITSLLFRQQLIETVYGVTRLYTDLVALTEDVQVKQDALDFAQKLFDNTQIRVDEGTQAPLELTRARAQVSASRQDLINSQGLLEEQQAIMKNVLTRRGNEDPEVRNAKIIPTDSLSVPAGEETRPIDELLSNAYTNRPDLGQAGLQIANSELALKGSLNNLRPELDLIANAQNNALAGTVNPLAPSVPDSQFVGGYGSVLNQLFSRSNPTVEVGIQFTLPVRNRVAQADAVREELQLRQTQVRERQLRNQVQLEVEDALIAMRRARASYEAAVETRKLQEESLDLEQIRFNEGVSTSFFVIQYESYVAQAKSTELAAKGSYFKARAALQRAVGSILDDNHILFDAALNGHM